jgi:hypothetical protein
MANAWGWFSQEERGCRKPVWYYTQFFYYVHEKPKAETQLAYFVENNVNLDFRSDHDWWTIKLLVLRVSFEKLI